MKVRLSDDPELLEFWEKELDSMSLRLFNFLRDISTKIPSNPKMPFYLYFNWRLLDGRIWGIMRMALTALEQGALSTQVCKDKVLNHVVREFKEALNRNRNRMSRTKFSKFELSLSAVDSLDDLGIILLDVVPTRREWEGNFKTRFAKNLSRLFSLRFETPKRIRRQERIRGYRDHGSMSSDSERARKAANTSTWPSQLQEMLEFIQRYGYSVEYTLRVFNMESRE